MRAVGHRDRLRMLRGEVRGRELDHLAGTDEQDVLAAQVAEDALRHPHGGGRHRYRLRADLGGRPHFLRNREGALEQVVQHQAEATGAARPASRPASSARGSAVRPAPSNRARWRRGRRGAPRSPVAARRCGVAVRPGSAAFRRRRTPAAPAARARARRRRSTARSGCRSRRSRPPKPARRPVRTAFRAAGRSSSTPPRGRTPPVRARRAARSCGSGPGSEAAWLPAEGRRLDNLDRRIIGAPLGAHS